jgi:hypothetical protein
MTILIVAPFVVGVRFFKALVLVPTCVVVLMVVVVRAACVGHGLLNAILEFAVVITSLQIGYASTLVLAAVPRILQRVSSGHLHQKTVTRHRS